MSVTQLKENKEEKGNLFFMDNIEDKPDYFINGFTQVQTFIWLSTLSDKAVRLYGYMVNLKNIPYYEISIYNLSKDFNCNEKTIDRVLQELKKEGYLKIIPHQVKGQRKLKTPHNFYE